MCMVLISSWRWMDGVTVNSLMYQVDVSSHLFLSKGIEHC